MKMDRKIIGDKCRNVKFYASIKYMAHTLKARERTEFIKIICDYNVYLACICAMTCESDIEVENYIWKCLNSYFNTKQKLYIDKLTGAKIRVEVNKKLKSDDITNYLLACHAIGNIKAIKWYIYNHEVQKPILNELGKNFRDNELVDLLFTLFKSEKNWDKIRGIGSTRNLFLFKNDYRILSILKGLWYKDKNAFIQLAFDTGWLGELHNNTKIGEKIYIQCLDNATKVVPALEMLADSLNDISNNIVGIERLQNIFISYAKDEERDYIYLIYYIKIKYGFILTDYDYKILNELGDPRTKIKNYFISFFKTLINNNYTDKVNYFEYLYSCKKVIGKRITFSDKTGYDTPAWKILKDCLVRYPNTDIDKVIFFYLKSTIDSKVTLDTLFNLVNEVCEIPIEDFIGKLKSYPIWVRVMDSNDDVCNVIGTEVKTRNYMVLCNEKFEVGSSLIVKVIDYDYINKVFYLESYQGNLMI